MTDREKGRGEGKGRGKGWKEAGGRAKEGRTNGEGRLRSRPTGGRVGRWTEKVSDPLGGDVPE